MYEQNTPAAPTNQCTPFPEINYLRLGNQWQESNKYASANGTAASAGRTFMRYELRATRNTAIDFCDRGHRLSEKTAALFHKMLQTPHFVDESELFAVKELFSGFLAQTTDRGFVHIIESAKVARLNGRSVLQIQWQSRCGSMKCISVFIDPDNDGSFAHEIHFYTPGSLYDRTVGHFFDSMRTLQWSGVSLPPMFKKLTRDMNKIAS